MPLSLPIPENFTKGSPYILALPKWYPNKVDNADGNFIEKHIECISTERKMLVLFVKGIRSDIQKEPEIKLHEKSSNLLEISIYFPSSQGLFSSILNAYKYVKHSFSAFNSIEKQLGIPSICHLHVMGRNGLLALKIRQSQQIPFVVSEHWSAYFKESNKLSSWKKIGYRYLFKRSAEVTCVSQALGKALKKHRLIKEFKVIPNVIDQVFFSTPLSQPSAENKRLVHISNLTPEIKQTDKMLMLLDEVAKKRNDFEVYIVGDGQARKALETLSEKLPHLSNRVHFTGDISQKEIAEILKTATAGVLFSKFETQSIVLLESLAMGVPVVAPRVGGIPEHCENKGFLFTVNEGAEFNACIERALDNQTSFKQSELREYCEQNFSCHHIAGKFVDIYNTVQTR